ncbi:MAG: hypothetical protein IJJ11_00895 [Methanosphaera sp.]|nr:hypothetical protein [Methanosphaera sp.]
MLILLSLTVILCSFTVISASDVNDAVDDSILTDSNGENNHNQEAVLTDANSIGSSEIKAIQKKDNSKNRVLDLWVVKQCFLFVFLVI